jgi:tRNA(Ile)-lysidine synthase
MAGSRRLRELVDSAQNRLRLPATPFTVALSGGADSAALAYLAVQHDPAVDALHIDHGLPASTMLREAAAEIAAMLEMGLDIVTVGVREGPSLEEQARIARYEVLDSWHQSVVTAHTRDDNGETILINLIRGTAATGLGGIPYHRPPHIYRPTLDITRDETREMATLVGLPFRDDPMNSDPSLMRNRIRHEIIPRAREMNPQVIEALARAGAAVTADSILLDEMVAHIDTRSGVAVGVLTTLPRPLADRVLGRLLSSAGVGLTEDRLARARSVVEGRAERQDLAEGLSVVRRNAMVVIE